MEAAIEEHVAHLRRLGRQPGSVYQRQRALDRLARHIAPTPILEVTLDQLRDFTSRPSTGRSATAHEVSHFRMFFRWAILEELVDHDPTLRLERPKVPKGGPRPMPDEEVEYALAFAPERVRPWLHLAAYGGLRACEIGPIRGEHVIGDRLFIPQQKGGAPGYITIAPSLWPVIRSLPKRGWWFPHRGAGPEGPTSAQRVSQVANRWLHREGIAHTLHTLRHWCGTEVRRVAGDVLVAAEVLRHESLESTRIYTKLPSEAVAEAVAGMRDLTQAA